MQSSQDDDTTQEEPINYTADTRCAARFACLKEEILELYRHRSSGHHGERVNAIRSKVEKQWEDLPPHFKLQTSLKDCRHLSPFERDFLVGTRLDYLHTLLLLGLISLQKTTEPDQSILATAGEMLSLVVAQFGLPAAGVISLALLNSAISSGIARLSRSKMVQDLSVLVAEIRAGALIQAGEPNFALFTRATSTMQSLLDSLMVVWRSPEQPAGQQQTGGQQGQMDVSGVGSVTDVTLDDWNACIDFEPWEFEQGFWASLAVHPTLLQDR
ncbi:Zn-c6 fungal-type DNA-binding domain [Lasiodiplodia theobromae]|uniref:Zn-c6 fungal-type DNA-binding domain n=1 Tax=Lasiodiplodia theobromae TaxID=45133 RepID=UPI0015C36ECF|nr:Zn-c6 fungal-type DNA-binding domain [Lasiodiplodia theobromae]KAF4534949.1 Zn-c6 fungal-type DNA-binding domain [Lasiodiplodia theobromae]